MNGLPICQLRRLQTLVDMLYGSEPDVSLHRSDMPERLTIFWMDTLCVPLHDDECRKLAISEMRDVYALADRVLVLDSWILNGSVEDSIAERSTRLMMSHWARRLWTLSEAVLARNLYIQFRDATEHTETLFAQCKNYSQCGDEFYDSTPAYALVKSLPTLWFGPDVPIFRRFDALVYHIGQRATSRPSDETICFSDLLGMSTKTLLDIPQEELQTRMATFLRMVGTFRQQMIFNAGPRCQAEGFGWAPISFLNRPEATVVTDRGECDNRVVTLDPCGGLLVTYSGIRLGSVGTSLGQHCVITFDDQKDSGLLCTFRIYGAREAIAPWNPAWDYFVISNTPVTQIMGGGPSQSVALIGCLQDAVNGRLKIKSLRKAVLLQLSQVQVQQFVQFWSHCPNPSDETYEARLIEGTRLGEDQEWCVV